MNTQIGIEEIKQIELSILDYINTVCENNGIKYFLSYGTLLGAVRHKGFIPWDDDIDVGMLREDYEKFIDVTNAKPDDRYKLLYLGNDNNYYHEFAKVVDVKTRLAFENIIENPKEGVWVDIFPIDELANCRRIQKIIINTCLMCRLLSVFNRFPRRHSILLYPVWLFSRAIGFKPFLKVIDKLSKRGGDNRYAGYIASYGSNKYYFKKEIFSKIITIQFEGKDYPVPESYDEYLSYLYGNYMELPPIEQRVSRHSAVAYWR